MGGKKRCESYADGITVGIPLIGLLALWLAGNKSEERGKHILVVMPMVITVGISLRCQRTEGTNGRKVCRRYNRWHISLLSVAVIKVCAGPRVTP
jgi:hypothetical protein